MTDNPVTILNQHPATAVALQRIASAPARLGVQETTDPEEVLFVELVLSGESITGAFMRAAGKVGTVDIDAAEMRSWSGAAQEYRSRPGVNALLQRRLRDFQRTRAQDGALTRVFIEKRLLGIIEDEMVEPKTAISAIDRLAKLTHVQAFAPPTARKEDEVPSTTADTIARIKKILKQGE